MKKSTLFSVFLNIFIIACGGGEQATPVTQEEVVSTLKNAVSDLQSDPLFQTGAPLERFKNDILSFNFANLETALSRDNIVKEDSSQITYRITHGQEDFAKFTHRNGNLEMEIIIKGTSMALMIFGAKKELKISQFAFNTIMFEEGQPHSTNDTIEISYDQIGRASCRERV